MEDESEIVKAATKEMDKQLKSVMPDTWMGHARFLLADKDLHPKKREGILQRTEKLVDENGYPSEMVAQKFLDRLEE